MGFLGLQYRRPAQQPVGQTLDTQSEESLTADSIQSIRSNLSAGIPSALSFDRIIDGGTCPPCTVRDFMNYLMHIEHAAENLQFFLWYKGYETRFHSAATADLALAPEWTEKMQEQAFDKLQKDQRDALKRDPAHVADMFKGTDFEKKSNTAVPGSSYNNALDSPIQNLSETCPNPFATPPQTPQDQENLSIFSGASARTGATATRAQAAEAFASSGANAPFTIQPFREEIDRVVATYIKQDAPRELNLSARERKQLLTALSHTTHPSAFRQVVWSVEAPLRMQAHPNFIRWSICNGNPPRVAFAYLLCAGLIGSALLAYVLLCLSSVPRGLRAVPAGVAVLGVAMLSAARKGMCVVLHGMHHRHVRPWELFTDEEVELQDDKQDGFAGASKESFETFGSANSYEDAPWVVKYQKRKLIRKVFDKEVCIHEPALRTIQDTIFVQAMLVGLLTAGSLTTLFVCVPGGPFF